MIEVIFTLSVLNCITTLAVGIIIAKSIDDINRKFPLKQDKVKQTVHRHLIKALVNILQACGCSEENVKKEVKQQLKQNNNDA